MYSVPTINVGAACLGVSLTGSVLSIGWFVGLDCIHVHTFVYTCQCGRSSSMELMYVQSCIRIRTGINFQTTTIFC